MYLHMPNVCLNSWFAPRWLMEGSVSVPPCQHWAEFIFANFLDENEN